jgi:transcriptional repressor OPI1
VLQPKRSPQSPKPSQNGDVEKGLAGASLNDPNPGLELAYTETLPAYSAGDRSPPYSEQQLVVQNEQRQPPPGWRQQLMISTSGLGVAMSEESLRSLRFCLSWLRWANGRLGEAIQNIKALLERWNEGVTPSESVTSPMSVASITQSSDERRQAVMTARIAALKKDVLETLKQVVGIVSNYAGGALPQNARDLVHRHLTSLPQRFTLANAMIPSGANAENEAENSANRVMVLAQEGLDMMTQVSRVVNDTLVSAEGWCEKLGRKTGKEQPLMVEGLPPAAGEKQGFGLEGRERSLTVENLLGDAFREKSEVNGGVDGDVKMGM